MLQSLLSIVTAKAVAVAAGAATVAGGAALVTLPDAAGDAKAVETVEQIEAGELPDPAGAIEVAEEEGEEGAELQSEGTPPEDTFGATVHELQEQHPDRGEEFGQAVADAAQEHAAERRDAAPIPDVARDQMAEPGTDEAEALDEGDDEDTEADAGPPEDVPAGPPAGTPGRPGG